MKDIFFHVNELRGIQYGELREGDVVLFTIAEGPRGFVAVKIDRA